MHVNMAAEILESIKQKLCLACLVCSIIQINNFLLQYFIPLNSNLEHQPMFSTCNFSTMKSFAAERRRHVVRCRR